MSLLSLERERLRGSGVPSAARLVAFLAGYLGEPLDPGLDADPQLHRDYERGIAAHDRECNRMEVNHVQQ